MKPIPIEVTNLLTGETYIFSSGYAAAKFVSAMTNRKFYARRANQYGKSGRTWRNVLRFNRLQ